MVLGGSHHAAVHTSIGSGRSKSTQPCFIESLEGRTFFSVTNPINVSSFSTAAAVVQPAVVDPVITFGGNPVAPSSTVSASTLGIIKDALIKAGETSAVIIKSYQSPEALAAEMLVVLQVKDGIAPIEGINAANATYTGTFGRSVIKTFRQAEEGYKRNIQKYNLALARWNNIPTGPPPVFPTIPDYQTIIANAVKTIMTANPDTGFPHSRDPLKWNVIDIDPAGIANPQAFHNALVADKRIFKVNDAFSTVKDKAFHIEIKLA